MAWEHLRGGPRPATDGGADPARGAPAPGKVVTGSSVATGRGAGVQSAAKLASHSGTSSSGSLGGCSVVGGAGCQAGVTSASGARSSTGSGAGWRVEPLGRVSSPGAGTSMGGASH